MSKYEAIAVAYKSRFVYRTDADYRRELGTSFETLVSKRDSERDMDVYYSILDRKALSTIDQRLDDIIEDYLLASRLYLMLDWGDRSQMASRKRFCRMMFRLAITAGRPLSSDEIFKFKAKTADERLLGRFFPRGMENFSMTIIGLAVLFSFGIIRPWTADNSRGRDIRDSETANSLKKFSELIDVLKEDTPRLGSTEKPMAFDLWNGIIRKHLSEPGGLDDCSPLMILAVLLDIARACRSLVVSEALRLEGETYEGLFMHGIWVDDTDRGENRFWIFPDNMFVAMCFKRNGVAWELETYEFMVRQSDTPFYMESFLLFTPQGNLNYMLSPERVLDSGQMATGGYEAERDEATGEFRRILLSDRAIQLPEWLNWRIWERLDPEDVRYVEFRDVLTEVYNPRSPHSVIFQNTSPELTDNVNNLVGQDNKYLYVYDWHPKRFIIKESDPDVFVYEGDCRDLAINQSLFELNITEAHPLYAIPRDMARRKYGDSGLDRLAKVIADGENITEAYIIYSTHSPSPRLVFPTYGVSIELKMEILSRAGIKKFTQKNFIGR